MNDKILINRLRVPIYIGVPDEERAEQQELRLSLELTPIQGFEGLDDDIERAVNYYEVAQRVKCVALERPRKLIETLGEEITAMILSEFAVQEVVLEIEKYILPDTDWVGLRMMRKK